jgi:hypothetical protein
MSKNTDSKDDLNELFNELSKHVDIPTDTSPAAQVFKPSVPVVPDGDSSKSSFPTTMSCSQAFNELVGCYSIGGQMRHYYRYGSVSQCSDKREKFRFCLSSKLKTGKEQEAVISRYYREKLAEKRLTVGSSEDVWTARKTKVHKPFIEHE